MKKLQIISVCFSVFYLCFRIFTPFTTITTLKTKPKKQTLKKEIKHVQSHVLEKYGKIITENK